MSAEAKLPEHQPVRDRYNAFIEPEGKLAAMVLMLLGIGLFSAITATATSYLISTGRPADPSRAGQVVDELERLAGLREQGSLTDEEFVRAKSRLLG